MSNRPQNPSQQVKPTTRQASRDLSGTSAAVGRVVLNNGRAEGTLYRETDPEGHMVVHARRHEMYPHERMFSRGHITVELMRSGERFRQDYEAAHLAANPPAVNLLKAGGGGPNEMSDHELAAKQRIKAALTALGRDTLTASVVQHCCGEGTSLTDWAIRLSWGGRGTMDKNRASGLLVAGLERLAVHYGELSLQNVRESATKRTRQQAARDVLTLMDIMAGTRDIYCLETLQALRDEIHRAFSIKTEVDNHG